MLVYNYAAPMRCPLDGWSCARMHTIHLTLVAVPSLWMREGSWWGLSTIGHAWCLAIVLVTQGGGIGIPIGGSRAPPFVVR